MDILLVDDDQKQLDALVEVLEERGYELRTASDGRAALEHIAARVPELVISDVQMPRMDGITFLQVVQERFPDVPVVLMTGAGDETDSGAAFEYGARGFLHKPIRLDAFLAGIRRIEKAL